MTEALRVDGVVEQAAAVVKATRTETGTSSIPLSTHLSVCKTICPLGKRSMCNMWSSTPIILNSEIIINEPKYQNCAIGEDIIANEMRLSGVLMTLDHTLTDCRDK